MITFLLLILMASVFIGFFVCYLSIHKLIAVSKIDLTPLSSQMAIITHQLEQLRNDTITHSKHSRDEQSQSLKAVNDSLLKMMSELSGHQKNQLDSIRQTLEQRLGALQVENAKKLDEMRQTVDEKLHATLEKRLGESFQIVSERLEKVHQGLGEMQQLATGVGDLKRVLSNVKTRGIWGEVQLGNLLEQCLSPDQYASQVRTKPIGGEMVDFAVKLPGNDPSSPCWLPVDAKFPQDLYQRILDAQDHSPEAVEEAGKNLETHIKLQAKTIRDKYIEPPFTTDFGIMFLPLEGLYAEILRRPGLTDILHNQFRILVVGPTTLAALLNSLQMGFRTLQIQKRSSEVWSLLGNVKTEFGKFGDLLEKTHKKLQEAGNTIEDAARKSRTIEKRLRDVQIPETPGLESNANAVLLFSADTQD
jgi:DNA recombination protein RmuC